MRYYIVIATSFFLLLSVCFNLQTSTATSTAEMLNQDFEKRMREMTSNLKKRVGEKFWIVGNKVVEFYEEPIIFSDKFTTTKEITSFTIKEFIQEGETPYFSFYKVIFQPAGTAFIRADEFDDYLEQRYIFRNKDKNEQVAKIQKKEIRNRVGNKYWILEDNDIKFYEIPSLLTDSFSIKTKSFFTIKEVVTASFISPNVEPYYNFYKVSFDTGKEMFIWAHSFSTYLKNDDIITEEEEKEGTVEKERQKRKEMVAAGLKKLEEGFDAFFESAMINALLESAGISKGGNLWLKYPMSGLPWLTHVKLIECKKSGENLASGVILVVETSGREIYMRFPFDSDKIKEAFYTTDPTNRVAKWGKRTVDAIKKGKVFVGMTKEQVIASWGLPDDKNKDIGRWGKREQWIYRGNSAYLYMENNRLTAIQKR